MLLGIFAKDTLQATNNYIGNLKLTKIITYERGPKKTRIFKQP